MRLGTSPESLMGQDETAIDNGLKGFKVTGSATYLKKLKHILAKSDNDKIQDAMSLGGFGLQLGLAAEIDLTFDDEEDL